jgi:hypothetical protein
MVIEISSTHSQYLDMLVEAAVYPSAKIASTRVLEQGLNETEFHAWTQGAADMHFGVLKGEQVTAQVPDNLEYLWRLEHISKQHKISVAKAGTLTFLQGLFGHHLALEDSQLYKKDKDFSREG